tara:strand:- start:4517 stop:6544 length:2028 start_codon:yes stop_codon:yes gene_type:complete
MEQTIEQALKQGFTAHNKGNLQEAERVYKAVLRSHPKHPEACHNLGLIAIYANQIEVALPLFKTALEVNPMIEQFWLSYIDALVKANQLKDAKQTIKKAKKKGFDAKKLLALLSQTKGVADIKVPSHQQLSKLLEQYQYGRYDDAEKLARSLSIKFPCHNFSWKILGAVLKQTGMVSEAVFAEEKSVEINPKDAEAHNNLGVTLQELGRLVEAEVSCKQAIALKPDYAEAHSNLGFTLQKLGRLDEAEASYTQAILLKPNFAEAHYNLANTLHELGRLDEAEASYKQAIALKPDLDGAHINLGNVLKKLGRLEEAEATYTQAIALESDLAEAHNNLGVTLQKLGRLEEAEARYKQAVALKPDYADAHNNLGDTLKELGRLDEAEVSCKQALALKPDLAEAHNNLGVVLKELGRLEEAEASYTQAIALKPNFALAHINLGRVLYNMGYKHLALESIEKADHIDPQSKESRLILSVINSRKSHKPSGSFFGDASKISTFRGLTSNPLILNRVVEADLISYIYGMSSRALDKTIDTRFGNGRCSPDFNLFEDTSSIIKNVAEDLTRIIMEAVKSEIYISESFFNIVGAGGGINPHNHISDLDKDFGLDLRKKKYALQYYLSVGDQNCSEPGVLKLYEPVEDILPCKGMITIISASRAHSAVYDGKTDRVMIGVNFYSM